MAHFWSIFPNLGAKENSQKIWLLRTNSYRFLAPRQKFKKSIIPKKCLDRRKDRRTETIYRTLLATTGDLKLKYLNTDHENWPKKNILNFYFLWSKQTKYWHQTKMKAEYNMRKQVVNLKLGGLLKLPIKSVSKVNFWECLEQMQYLCYTKQIWKSLIQKKKRCPTL